MASMSASDPVLTATGRTLGWGVISTGAIARKVVPDIAAYDLVYKRLIADTELADVSSSFAMEEIKFTTALPLGYAD